MPTFQGPSGRAWRCALADPAEDPHGTLAHWLIYAPMAHPVWAWHWLGVLHLRPMGDLPDPARQFEGAGYEILVMAIDPTSTPPEPDAVGDAPRFLMPPDLMVQLAEDLPGGDAAAVGLGSLCVQGCCAGTLVPDSDHLTRWVASIGVAIDNARNGRHDLTEETR